MRQLQAEIITDAVRNMCIEANCILPDDVRKCIVDCHQKENWTSAKESLGKLIENYEIAEREHMPICQDTGVVCVFVEVGQDVHVMGDLNEAINEGVRQGYSEGYLRMSVVADPLRRVNTNDNTPAMIHYDVIPGDKLEITVAPKGFGSENMSKSAMLKPSEGIEGVKRFVLQTVEDAGANPCPPIVVGVGIGGTFDKVALLAKKALMQPLDEINSDPFYAGFEDGLLDSINSFGIGPQGFGGKTTALAVKVLTMPTHIAGLPVAVNLNCHVARHVSRII
ncbi:MAG: fumarate hydratase [Oscillospiraceae bacterium]|nr:fumarate hydratase [Oscillospiraceae bacterium]